VVLLSLACFVACLFWFPSTVSNMSSVAEANCDYATAGSYIERRLSELQAFAWE
jgi:hypothetical protein